MVNIIKNIYNNIKFEISPKAANNNHNNHKI